MGYTLQPSHACAMLSEGIIWGWLNCGPYL